MNDTIAAISTALGVGAISIIRVSGDKSIEIVNKIFDKDLEKVKSHTIVYGHIVDNENIIDEVLVSVMRSPKTFTTEDVIEINCHGGIATTNKVLELLLKNGARMAEAGEFTKRAFLNGRIDLLEAEGVMDLIDSKTEASRKLAMSALSGNVSSMISDLRNQMIEIITNIEVNIDYPEYEDILVVTTDMINSSITSLEDKLRKILKEAENGKIIKNGINTLIIGRPNVGKSSLLNKLLNEEKAIVTDIEGTTRDIVEGNISLDGVELNIIDTAGIRKTDNVVEQIGVNRSLSLIDKADLIILVLNNNEKLTEEDYKLLDSTKDRKRIIFINKNDLSKNIDLDSVDNVVYGSTMQTSGINALKDKIKELFNVGSFMNKNLTFFTNSRQIALLKSAIESLEEVENGVNEQREIDMIEIDLKLVWEKLGDIIGANYTEELVDNLFSRFCLGK